jgi:hypothetical protein
MRVQPVDALLESTLLRMSSTGGDWKSVWFGSWHKEPGGEEVRTVTRPRPEPAAPTQSSTTTSRFTVQHHSHEQHQQHQQQIRRYTSWTTTFNFLQVSPVNFPVIPQVHEQRTTGASAALRHPQVKELLVLYDRIHSTEFRAVIQMTMGRLAQHVDDDQIFLNLNDIERLPVEEQWDEGGADGSSSSLLSFGGRREESRGRAQATLMRQLYDALCRRSNLSNLVFVVGLKFTQMYRQRLAQAQRDSESDSSSTPSSLSSTRSVTVNPADVIQNAQHQLIVGIMLANKYTEDRPHSNAAWSRITGLPSETVNRLEAAFLRVLGHKMFIEEIEFKDWLLTLSRLLDWIPAQQRHLWQTSMNTGMQSTHLGVGGGHGLRFPTYVRKLAERRPSEGIGMERPNVQGARSQHPPGL